RRARGLGARRGAPRAGRDRGRARERARHGSGSGAAMTRAASSPPATDPLLEWRQEFPSLEHTLHFASHTLGAMPRGVGEALARYAEAWRTRGIRAWEEGWFALPTRLGNHVASILGAPAGTVSMHENVTIA